MAEPPRLRAIYLPWEQSVIYFVTICVKGRERVLDNDAMHQAISEIAEGLRAWETIAGVIMPEHLHGFVRPRSDRDLSVGDFSNAFKRLLRQRLGRQEWDWQRGCFDRLLRSNDSFSDKWAYVRENPVRAGLVSRWEEWPYFFGLIEEQRLGKPTASPTKNDMRDSNERDSDVRDSDGRDSDGRDSDVRDSDVRDSDVRDSDGRDSDGWENDAGDSAL